MAAASSFAAIVCDERCYCSCSSAGRAAVSSFSVLLKQLLQEDQSTQDRFVAVE